MVWIGFMLTVCEHGKDRKRPDVIEFTAAVWDEHHGLLPTLTTLAGSPDVDCLCIVRAGSRQEALEMVAERALYRRISLRKIGAQLGTAPIGEGGHLTQVMIREIDEAMQRAGGKQTIAARLLGITPRKLNHCLGRPQLQHWRTRKGESELQGCN